MKRKWKRIQVRRGVRLTAHPHSSAPSGIRKVKLPNEPISAKGYVVSDERLGIFWTGSDPKNEPIFLPFAPLLPCAFALRFPPNLIAPEASPSRKTCSANSLAVKPVQTSEKRFCSLTSQRSAMEPGIPRVLANPAHSRNSALLFGPWTLDLGPWTLDLGLFHASPRFFKTRTVECDLLSV
jgi:hypothetical protein